MYRSFKDMPVWQEAMWVAEEIFRLTELLPRKEDHGFTGQIRRSALSIPASLAEGFGRGHPKEKAKLYMVSRGCAAGTRSHLEYGRRVGYLTDQSVKSPDDRPGSLSHDLNKLISQVRAQYEGDQRLHPRSSADP